MLSRLVLLFTLAVFARGADKPDNRRLPVRPPAKARVLFDGSGLGQWTEYHNYLDNFQPSGVSSGHFRLVAGGAMEIDTGDRPKDSQCYLATREQFGDIRRLHVEFLIPTPAPNDNDQLRGNSGVYLQGRYEVQILESYARPVSNTGCGALYKIFAPRVNASLPPDRWQSFDIRFQAARIEAGKVIRPARITVRHNGIEIHHDAELNVPSTQRFTTDRQNSRGPIVLQHHWCPVRFRNIWIEE